jgi:hypothetical protein
LSIAKATRAKGKFGSVRKTHALLANSSQYF